jgi:KDO2-lipid IV(A) lauroyltransferase
VQDERPLVVVEPVEPPELFDWFVEVRSAMGMDVVALAGDTASRVLAALRANAVVCLLSDRDLTGTGVEVEFFGERTTLPAGPATLALRSGAAVLPAAVYFERARRHRAFVRPPLDTTRRGPRLRDDVERITQSLAREFEELVRAAPEQWHLMQPNWPSDLEVT